MDHEKLSAHHSKMAFHHGRMADEGRGNTDTHAALADSHALIAKYHAHKAGKPHLSKEINEAFDSPGRFDFSKVRPNKSQHSENDDSGEDEDETEDKPEPTTGQKPASSGGKADDWNKDLHISEDAAREIVEGKYGKDK